MFGALGGALHATSCTFVSQASLEGNELAPLNLNKLPIAVKHCRQVRKQDLIHNSELPKLEVDAQTYEVRADGQLLTCEPAKELPLAQRYFLF